MTIDFHSDRYSTLGDRSLQVSRQRKILRVEEFGSLWMAQQMDREVDLAGIVDDVVLPVPHERGPSLG